MMKSLLLFGFSLACLHAGSQVAYTQELGVRAKMEIDTTRILIGDQVNLWLNITQPAHRQLQFPHFLDTLITNVEIIDAFPPDTITRNNNLWSIRQRIILTSFDTGFYVLPAQTFMDAVTQQEYRTNALPLEVIGIEVDTTKGIADIKLPYDIPIGFWEIFPYLMVGVLLVGAILLWYFVLRKKKVTTEEPKISIPEVPPHIWALAELDRLVKEKLWQQGKNKLFYSRLTEIVRRYIEWRFYMPALEQTTREIIDAFQRNQLINSKLSYDLQNTLELADLVKFAKWQPNAEENELAERMAYDFVLQTKPTLRLRSEDSGQTTKEEEEA